MSGEEDWQKNLRKIEVMKLLAQSLQPHLWPPVKNFILEEGCLDVSGVNIEQHIPHLVRFMASGMAAKDVTSFW